MRNFSLLGLLLVVGIIGFWAKTALSPQVSHDPNDRSTVEYWVSHPSDRQTMLSWCSNHPEQQNSPDCKLVIAAQTEVDTNSRAGQAGQGGVDQATGEAVDQLQAQKDANILH